MPDMDIFWSSCNLYGAFVTLCVSAPFHLNASCPALKAQRAELCDDLATHTLFPTRHTMAVMHWAFYDIHKVKKKKKSSRHSSWYFAIKSFLPKPLVLLSGLFSMACSGTAVTSRRPSGLLLRSFCQNASRCWCFTHFCFVFVCVFCLFFFAFV